MATETRKMATCAPGILPLAMKDFPGEYVFCYIGTKFQIERTYQAYAKSEFRLKPKYTDVAKYDHHALDDYQAYYDACLDFYHQAFKQLDGYYRDNVEIPFLTAGRELGLALEAWLDTKEAVLNEIKEKVRQFEIEIKEDKKYGRVECY